MSSQSDVYLHSVKLAEKAHITTSEKVMSTFIFIKLTQHALTPTRESPNYAGFDLRSPYETTVPARGKELMKTDLKIKLPKGCYGRIAPKTDLALFHHLKIEAGLVDEDLRGNLSVLIFNHSENPYGICHGDKIAN